MNDALHVCAPRPVSRWRLVQRRPSEKRRRRMTAAYYEWYGVRVTCCGCGEARESGERLPRDRKRSAVEARAEWPTLRRWTGGIVAEALEGKE